MKVKAILLPLGKVAVNSAISGTETQLRPDFISTNEEQKIIMVDVTIPFENRIPAFCDARTQKMEKYAPLADALRAKGYQVQTYALIIEALCAYDPSNEQVLWKCGIGQCYDRLMGDSWCQMPSRDIYLEHISIHQQYQQR